MNLSSESNIPHQCGKVIQVFLKSDSFSLERSSLHIGKCASVENLTQFLVDQFELKDFFLTHKSKPLFSKSRLHDYPISHKGVIFIHSLGLRGGAKEKHLCEKCHLCFPSKRELHVHYSKKHPELVTFLESSMMDKYLLDQSKKKLDRSTKLF